MDEKPRRPWWKLHALTWIVGSLVAGALAAKTVWAWRIMSSRGAIGWPKSFHWREDASPPVLPVSVREWYIGPLLADALLAAVIVGGAVVVVELRQRQFGPLQLGLKWALIAPAWIASVMTIVQNDLIHDRQPLKSAVSKMSDVVVYAALMLTWLAFFDLLGIAWNRVTGRGATAPAANADCEEK